MRKVITVDVTFMNAGYGGQLVFASSQDPNHHHYPIAFGVIDVEKNDSWEWFFKTLKTVIPDMSDLVIVSDKNSSLIKTVHEVYLQAKHGYCIYHLSQNVKLRVKKDKDTIFAQFVECARHYTEAGFLLAYRRLAKRYPKVDAYLRDSLGEEKWARYYFPGEKYNIDTSNVVESMNSVFNDAREYSLLPMIDAIIGKVAEWFKKHRNQCVSAPESHKLVPIVENELHVTCAIAQNLGVTELNLFNREYCIIGVDGLSYIVDLRSKSCKCKRFDIDKYLCVYTIAALKAYMKRHNREEDIGTLDLCSKYYLSETWAEYFSILQFPKLRVVEPRYTKYFRIFTIQPCGLFELYRVFPK